MATAIIGFGLIVVCILGVKSACRRFSRRCCGTGDGKPARVRPTDRMRSHYPYEKVLSVGGMTCPNCARRIENALNGESGLYARVSFRRKRAVVRMKRPVSVPRLEGVIRRAGYPAAPEEKRRSAE